MESQGQEIPEAQVVEHHNIIADQLFFWNTQLVRPDGSTLALVPAPQLQQQEQEEEGGKVDYEQVAYESCLEKCLMDFLSVLGFVIVNGATFAAVFIQEFNRTRFIFDITGAVFFFFISLFELGIDLLPGHRRTKRLWGYFCLGTDLNWALLVITNRGFLDENSAARSALESVAPLTILLLVKQVLDPVVILGLLLAKPKHYGKNVGKPGTARWLMEELKLPIWREHPWKVTIFRYTLGIPLLLVGAPTFFGYALLSVFTALFFRLATLFIKLVTCCFLPKDADQIVAVGAFATPLWLTIISSTIAFIILYLEGVTPRQIFLEDKITLVVEILLPIGMLLLNPLVKMTLFRACFGSPALRQKRRVGIQV